MKKGILLLCIILVVVAVVLFVQSRHVSTSVQVYRDGTYTIDDVKISLIDGRAEQDIMPGAASKVITQYFGNEAFGDLNGDGTQDVAFLLTQTSGGSGTFYYAAVALKRGDGYEGINAVLLGDRIAPQTTEIRDGQLIVNYADRNPGEPFTTKPSLGFSKYFRVVGDKLVESK